MTAFSQLSPERIKDTPAIELGRGGFCFVVAALLRLIYPDAILCRLTPPSQNGYSHVFVRVGGKPLDIMGFRDVEAMRFDLDGHDLIEEVADPEQVRDFFCRQYSPIQLAAAITVLSAHIDAHYPDCHRC